MTLYYCYAVRSPHDDAERFQALVRSETIDEARRLYRAELNTEPAAREMAQVHVEATDVETIEYGEVRRT